MRPGIWLSFYISSWYDNKILYVKNFPGEVRIYFCRGNNNTARTASGIE